MRDFERRLAKKIRKEVPDLGLVTPGIVVEVYKRGEVKGHLRMGDTYQYYDLASLTKLIFSATAWMRWVSRSDFDLHLPVYYFLTWWHHRHVRVDATMTHSAGLEWWRPFYKMFKGPVRFETRWPQMIEYLKSGKPKPHAKSVYSDLDLFLLAFLLEELEQKPLPEIWHGIRDDFEFPVMDFNENNRPRHARSFYAPTEDCPWRKMVLQGEVHDDNTWSLGGLAPHAGLFSNMQDVGKWALYLRKALMGSDETPFGKSAVAQAFVSRQIPRSTGDWGFLFMKPAKQGSSCGRHFSKDSFGHTGFVGTSVWFDPKKDLIVIILSNRVYPTRNNQAFVQLRPKLHDWICETL